MQKNNCRYVFHSNDELLSKKEVEEVFSVLEFLFGTDVDTELNYYNHYQLLVAIMLSAQATDKSVNKISDELFKILKSPQDAVDVKVERINKIIKNINYHNTKSKHIVEMSKMLLKDYNGEVPNVFEELIKLPGVGRKTANLILSIAFHQQRITIDTHCFRVANRLGLTKAKSPFETEKQLAKIIPETKYREVNSLLIPFGRTYCKALKPKCEQCKLKHICKFYHKKKKKLK